MENKRNILKKNWLEYSVITLLTTSLLFIYLSPYWSFEDSSRSASLIRIMLFLTSVFLIPCIVSKSKIVNSQRIKIAPVNILLSVLFLYLFANSFFITEDLQSARRLLVLIFLFLPFVFLNLSAQFVRNIVMFISFVIAMFAAYSLINQYLQGGLPTGYRKGELVSSGINGIASFGNTIVAAMHYAIGFTILAYLFFTESRGLLLWLWAILLSFIVVYIALTFARSAWVTCLVSSLVIYSLTFNKTKVRFYVIPALLLLVLLYFVINFFGYEVGERGLTYRDETWGIIVSRMEGYWIFGYGLSTPFEPISIAGGRQIVYNAHNVYLEIVYQVGLIGLVLYLLTLCAAIYTLFKAYLLKVYSDLSILFLALLIAVSVVMLIELNSWIHTPNLLWMWLWVPIAVSLSFERKINKSLALEKSVTG